MADSTINHDINFLYEIGTLRNIRRAWNQLSPAKFENITEHTFKTVWIAFILTNI